MKQGILFSFVFVVRRNINFKSEDWEVQIHCHYFDIQSKEQHTFNDHSTIIQSRMDTSFLFQNCYTGTDFENLMVQFLGELGFVQRKQAVMTGALTS